MCHDILDLQVMRPDHLLQDRKTASAIDRMHRLQSVLPLRHDDIRLLLQASHISHSLLVEKRHVAGNHEHMFGRSLAQSRIETTQASAIRDEITNDSNVCLQRRTILGDHDTNILKDGAQHRKAPFKERTLPDVKESLI